MLQRDRYDAITKLAEKKLSPTERVGKLTSHASRWATRGTTALETPLVSAAAFPFRVIGDLAGLALFGNKAVSGPMRGQRLKPVAGGPGVGMSQIDRARYEAIKAGKVPGKAFSGALEGHPMHFERKFAPGGLVGYAQRHPGKAMAVGALGAYLLTHRDKAGPAYELARGFVPVAPAPDRGVSAQTVGMFSQQTNTNNPLTSNTWG